MFPVKCEEENGRIECL